MSLKRIGILLSKEFLLGPKGFIFGWIIFGPIAISLLITLIFSNIFADTAKLGLVDEGDSPLTDAALKTDSIITREYNSDAEVRQAVENGSVDMGLVLPADFDSRLSQGQAINLTVYVWGESLAKNRSILGVTILDLIRETGGQEAPVEIESIILGDEISIPWNDRLLPFIVLMAIFLGGIMVPAASIINEKEKKTINALLVSPASIADVFIAKGIAGAIMSLIVGILILLINQAFSAQPLLLVGVLSLGAILASELGLILGTVMNNITNMFALWKSGGILLFGPAFIYMFPQIPMWVGQLFPTFYLIQPVVDISQRSGGWSEIAPNVFILIGIDIVLVGVIAVLLKRKRQLAD
jgi:ABC-2 type transport system permease protein